MQDGARELFRIDAKAEGDRAVIRGWDMLGELGTTRSRWFSTALTRRNSPLKANPSARFTGVDGCINGGYPAW